MDRVAALPAPGFEGGKRCEQFSEHSERCLHGSCNYYRWKEGPVHNQGCAFSAREVWAGMAVWRGRGWLRGQSGPSKARPAREGARLVTRHQEETSNGV